MVDYAVDLVRATRPKEPGALDFIKNWLAWGAGPRAAQYIVLAAKARAILHGRLAVSAGDIRAVVRPVLRHRIFTNFNADAEGVDADQIIDKILQSVPEPSYGEPVAKGERIGEAIRSSQDQVRLVRRPVFTRCPLANAGRMPYSGMIEATEPGDACLIPRQLTIRQCAPE